MQRPSPIPLVLICLVDVRNPNNLKSFLISWGDIPTPVSSTDICRRVDSPFMKCLQCSTWMRLSTQRILLQIILTEPPGEVNLRAFDCRFRMTCWILCESEQNMQLKSSEKPMNSAVKLICMDSACSCWTRMISLTILRRSKL